MAFQDTAQVHWHDARAGVISVLPDIINPIGVFEPKQATTDLWPGAHLRRVLDK